MVPELISVTTGDAAIGVSPDGAQLLSWQVAGRELIFVSSHTAFGQGVSVRGGIPICFPWFGRKAQPSHGLVRTARWEVSADTEVGEIIATTSFTGGSGPAGYLTDATITIRYTLATRQLDTTVIITNDGEQEGLFDLALHTYYAVDDVERLEIGGIRGEYTDTGQAGYQEEEPLIPKPPLDRIYPMSAPTTIGHIIMEPDGFTNTVVWNPGIDHGLADLADGENAHFICVEPMRDGTRCAPLPAGESATLTMRLSLPE